MKLVVLEVRVIPDTNTSLAPSNGLGSTGPEIGLEFEFILARVGSETDTKSHLTPAGAEKTYILEKRQGYAWPTSMTDEMILTRCSMPSEMNNAWMTKSGQ